MMKNGCEAGCKIFTGGEVKHQPYCRYYAESMSKLYDDLQSEVKKLRLQNVINWVAITTPPTVDCFYLVYDRTYGMISKALYDNEFHLVEDIPDIEITHWAHLPKPPCLSAGCKYSNFTS